MLGKSGNLGDVYLAHIQRLKFLSWAGLATKASLGKAIHNEQVNSTNIYIFSLIGLKNRMRCLKLV